MNQLLDDETIVARLRSALDELTTPDDFATPGDELPMRPQHTMTPARWMAVAAATVLVIGAVAAVAVNRSNRSDVASTPTTVPSTTPATTVNPTESTLVRVETKWFTIISPDLVAGERTIEQCCRDSLPGPLLTMAWSSGDTFLALTEYPAGPVTDVFPDANSTVREAATATLLFHSFGLTADERDALAAQVVAGSGLPYVLPMEGWGLTAMGQTAGSGRLVQMYTPLNTDPLSSYLPTVTMSAGEYRGELDLLGLWPDGQPVTVAGYDGWKVSEADGAVTVFWDTGDGNWATLRIDAQLADRTDGLIAAVVEVDPAEPTVDTVLAPLEPDGLSVGDVIPGELRPMASAGPTLFVFVNPACVPCDDAIRDLVATQEPGGLQLPQLALVALEPWDDAGVDDWLARLGWAGTVIRDVNGVIGARVGVTAVPSYVFVTVDSEGVVLDVVSGLFTSDTLNELGIE